MRCSANGGERGMQRMVDEEQETKIGREALYIFTAQTISPEIRERKRERPEKTPNVRLQCIEDKKSVL